jgi:gamma-glutamyltranspeptidase / glutathione hydrolase
MVVHTQDGKNIAIDYREKAPLAASRDMYLDEEGNFDIRLSTEGTTSSGVPGSVAGLIHALENYGTMSLADVIQPAINLAELGFPLSYKTSGSFKSVLKQMDYPSSLKVFSKDGIPYEEGEIFKQPDLAQTLKLIKEKGRDGFYKGTTAQKIVDQVQSLGGYITLEDLEKYQSVERTPVIGSYRGHTVVSMSPPSSGGIVLTQLLNILENINFTKDDWGSSKHIHFLSEAMKYAYADRSLHIGDSDFYNVPADWLTSKEYAKEIFNRINAESAIPSTEIFPGEPLVLLENEETTHYSVYDSFGNAVSTTTTINSWYGNKIVVEGAGFLLNNEMDDFSSKPGTANQFGLLGGEANSIQPEKRMLSAMTPTIILKDDKPFLIAGSPGGSTIITVVLQVIMNCIDFGMDIQTAINQPRIHHQWFPERIDFEEFGLTLDVKQNLTSKGHIIGFRRSLGRVEGIMIDHSNKIIYGATDPRGYGAAVGF